MESDLVDRTFLAKYLKVREEKLPIESNFYRHMTQLYAGLRQDFESQWGPRMNDPVPEIVRDFYNQRFEDAAALMNSLYSSFSVPASRVSRARKIYGVRIPPRATLRELCRIDAFSTQTHNLDIPVDLVLEGVDLAATTGKKTRDHVGNTLHMFLHRAQETEFIFLHEIIIGYLVNQIHHKGKSYESRAELPLLSTNYWMHSDYVVRLMAKVLNWPVNTLVGLHLADSDQIRKELPQSIQDLCLVASHIFWYLEQFNKLGGYGSVARLLSCLYNFFVIPSLELIGENPDVRLRSDTGRITDRLLCGEVLAGTARGPDGPNEMDLVRYLIGFVDELWSDNAQTENSESDVA